VKSLPAIPAGARLLTCHLCDGFDLLCDEGRVESNHEAGCEGGVHSADCVCDKCVGDYDEEDDEPHEIADEAFAVSLRLLIGAAESDEEAVSLALADFPDCASCERSIWFGVLRLFETYSSPELVDRMRDDLLGILDSIAAADAE